MKEELAKRIVDKINEEIQLKDLAVKGLTSMYDEARLWEIYDEIK